MEQTELQTLFKKITLNCKGRLLSLESPVVMGILNVTPDSFYDGGKHLQTSEALKQVEKMIQEGASIIDIGGYSSRPGADDPGMEEELSRCIPVIEAVATRFPEAILSVDTFRAEVAKQAVQAGAHIINDISAGDDDPGMMTVAALHGVPYIMMHKKGTPRTMQANIHYDNVVTEVIDYFIRKKMEAAAAGIKDLVIDPGFGFGKAIHHNYQLLHSLADLQILGLPILAGISRKKMIRQVAGTTTEASLNATSAANTVALMNGAAILRVHDVKEAVECIKIVNAVNGAV